MYEELKLACEEFAQRKIRLEEFNRRLSWLAYPVELKDLIKSAEYDLENIRFLTSTTEHYEKAMEIINVILNELSKVGHK
jgi:hypothetical protein